MKYSRGKNPKSRGNAVKHKMAGTSTYNIWASMRQRCDNEKCINYINYGARGITYDRRWEDFEEFLKDMGERPSGLSLDRIDNNSGYSKENCRWATRTVQNRNTRRAHLFNGKTLKEWSEILGVRRGTLAQRYYVYGWSVDRVLGIIK